MPRNANGKAFILILKVFLKYHTTANTSYYDM